ncbi:MAG: magnesium transporter [Flavobacteriales bacterium]|nr:magnesium transporter [Flavobacteriales bacterium]
MQITLTKELLANLRQWIAEGRDASIIEVTNELHHADLAELLNELRNDEAVYIYRLFDEENAAEVMLDLDDEVREKLLSSLTSREIAEDLIDNIDSDDAADVLADLSEQKQEEVIALLEDEDQASDIIDLLNYKEGTAGALMATELVHVNQNWTVGQAIREMRKQAEHIEHIYTIYVLDDRDLLLGTLSIKSMIFASASMRTTIRELYKPEKIQNVTVHTTAEDVANIMEKYDLVVLPVVNDAGALVGRITIDDVVDVIKDEAAKDYQMASGISEDVESHDSVLMLTRARLPWLLIGMAGGITSAYTIGLYKITEHPEMAIFMPLIAAMGGNVGIQSAALVVRALANQSALDETLGQKLAKELRVGLLNAIVCSTIIVLVSMLFRIDLHLAITASIALFAVIVFASFFGTWIPMTLNKFKIDPAIATGPFVTTLNDIFGLLIYFTIGHYIPKFIDDVHLLGWLNEIQSLF